MDQLPTKVLHQWLLRGSALETGKREVLGWNPIASVALIVRNFPLYNYVSTEKWFSCVCIVVAVKIVLQAYVNIKE